MSDPVAASTPSQNSNGFFDDFNFDDGNIIISASGKLPEPEQKKTEVVTQYFRVHKSVLKLHSTTFADLFTVPQPDPTTGGDQQTVDGVAVVHLHDDLLDLKRLMTVMYYGDAVPQTPLYQATFDFLAPVVQLADKYGMDKVVDKYLPRIRANWPISLEKWDHNEGQIKLFVTYQHTLNDPEHADDHFVEPCSAIRFARKQGVRNILPSAFYHLSRVSPQRSFDGPEEYYEYKWRGSRTANWSLLTTEDYRTLQIGQRAIRSWVLQQVHGSGYRLNHKGEERCRQDWWATVMEPHLYRILHYEDIDVLARLAEIDERLNTTGLCNGCRAKATGFPKHLRATFWMELPGFFELDPEDWGSEDEPMF